MSEFLLVFNESKANISTLGSDNLRDDHSDVMTNVADDTTHASYSSKKVRCVDWRCVRTVAITSGIDDEDQIEFDRGVAVLHYGRQEED